MGHRKSAGNCSLSISWYTPNIAAENHKKVIEFEVFQQGDGGISLIFSNEGDITTSKVKEHCWTDGLEDKLRPTILFPEIDNP